jgi:hypothetical protein
MAVALLAGFSLVACGDQGGTEAPSGAPASSVSSDASVSEPAPTANEDPSTAATVATTVGQECPEPRVVEAGLSYTNEGESLTWAALIEIPADCPASASLTVEVDFVDAGNRILDSHRESSGVVSPGQLLAVTGVLSRPVEGITGLDARLTLSDPEPDHAVGEWIFSEVAHEVEESGMVTVTGFISHTFPDDKETVIISNVYYLDGQIVGGDFGPVHRVPPGREARFDLVSLAAPEFDEVKQYVSGYRSPSDALPVADAGQPEPQVIDSGLSYTNEGVFLSWAALIEIPSDFPKPASLWVEVEFLDEHDRIVGNTRTTSRVVFPGQALAATGIYSPPVAGITRVDVFPALGLVSVDEAEGEWTITDVAHAPDEYNPVVVTGFISHSFPDDKANLFVSEVFYRDGRIVGGDFGPVERVPAGQEVRFELRSVAQIEFDNVKLAVWSYHNS